MVIMIPTEYRVSCLKVIIITTEYRVSCLKVIIITTEYSVSCSKVIIITTEYRVSCPMVIIIATEYRVSCLKVIIITTEYWVSCQVIITKKTCDLHKFSRFYIYKNKTNVSFASSNKLTVHGKWPRLPQNVENRINPGISNSVSRYLFSPNEKN